MNKSNKDDNKDVIILSVIVTSFVIAIIVAFTIIILQYTDSIQKMSISSRKSNTQVSVNADDSVVARVIEEPNQIELIASNLEESINFLVCGIDYAEGELRGHLTDVILLINYDRVDQKVNVLQIPRDTYVGEKYATTKINAVYGSKKKESDGIAELITVVQNTFSIYIDHYLTLNMDEFITVIDKIGGVEVDVPVNIDLEGYTIRKGLQLLDGKHAQIFVRERLSYQTGDLGRIEMQEVFLKALIKKIFTLGKSEMIALIPSLLKEINTDLSVSEVISLYEEIVQLNYNTEIKFHDLEVVGITHNGLSILAVQPEPASRLLNDYFRPHQDDVDADDLGIINILGSGNYYGYTYNSYPVQEEEDNQNILLLEEYSVSNTAS